MPPHPHSYLAHHRIAKVTVLSRRFYPDIFPAFEYNPVTRLGFDSLFYQFAKVLYWYLSPALFHSRFIKPLHYLSCNINGITEELGGCPRIETLLRLLFSDSLLVLIAKPHSTALVNTEIYLYLIAHYQLLNKRLAHWTVMLRLRHHQLQLYRR